MPRETTAQRRAREAAELAERRKRWEAERPMRLLEAMAMADRLGIQAKVFIKDNELWYLFNFTGDREPDYMDNVSCLGEYTMNNIEFDLNEEMEKKNKSLRLEQVRRELLEKLTDEEKEALGLE